MKTKEKARYDNPDPSVTSITDILEKDWIIYWIRSKGFEETDAIKQVSQKIGKKVHRGIELHLKGKPFSQCSKGMDNDQKLMLLELIEWCQRKKLVAIKLEKRMHSEKYKFNGTPDVIGTFNGAKTLIIIDWKTDSKPRDKTAERERFAKYKYQAGGYAILYEEKYKVKINKAVFVRISKKLEFNDIYFDDLKQAKKSFLALRQIYREIKGK